MPKHAEANLLALIESTQDIIWAVDLDYRLLTFNRAFKKAFEVNFGILVEVGMSREGLLPPERAALFPPLYKRALAEGPFRTDYLLRDGRTLELSFNPIVVDGKTIGISVFGKDITERKQAEANLSALIESTEDLIWSVDLDFRLIAFNQSVEKTLKRNRGVEVALGKTADQLLPPELAGYLNGLFQRTLTEGPFRTEYTLLDGRIIELALNPIVMDGKTTGVSIFGKDITKRKLAEKELQEAEKKYRDIFDGAQEGIFQTTFEGRHLTVNPAMARMLGYDSTEDFMATVGDVAQDIWVDPGERARLIRLLEKHGAIRRFQCQFRRKDGAVIWASLNSRKINGPDGKSLINEGFMEDITERKRTEMQLRDSEERYRNVFQTGPNTAVISRLSDGVIIDANQAFLDSTGFERNEVIGKTVLDLGIWVNASERQRFVDAVLRNKTCRDFEVLSRRKNGETFWIRLSASLIEIGGNRCLLAFGQDISEAKAAEELLAKAQEALRASEVRYRTAFQMNLDSVDICHKEDGKFIDVNDAFLSITGFAREDVIGHTALEIGIWENPEDRQKLLDA